jgi:hypothetical protein
MIKYRAGVMPAVNTIYYTMRARIRRRKFAYLPGYPCFYRIIMIGFNEKFRFCEVSAWFIPISCIVGIKFDNIIAGHF